MILSYSETIDVKLTATPLSSIFAQIYKTLFEYGNLTVYVAVSPLSATWSGLKISVIGFKQAPL